MLFLSYIDWVNIVMMNWVENEHFCLYDEQNKCIIKVFKKDFSLKEFMEMIKNFPRIKITKIINMRKAFQESTGEPVIIGEIKPLVELYISEDKMTAKIKLNATITEMENNKESYLNEIVHTLQTHKIKNYDLNALKFLPVGKEVIAAKGIQPTDGEDAQIRYFTLSERKPVIREDGKADFHMTLIDEVKVGDWLGEKRPATKGTNGINVFGEVVNCKAGKDRKLDFDQKTVEAVTLNDGRTELRSLLKGVVLFKNGKISVGQLLVIPEDVCVKTGNIVFDGSVTIKGTVQEGFSVIATEDISIEEEMGVSSFKLIESKHGDIYIKGGAFGKGISKIIANNNVYIKHINDCIVEAEGDIHLGLYAYGSHLKAKNLLGDDKYGKIVGGEIEVQGKVVCAYIGNERSRATVVKVNGINRTALYEEVTNLLETIQQLVDIIEKLKKQIEIFEKMKPLNIEQNEKLYKMKNFIVEKQHIISQIERKRKNLMSLLEIRGDGQVSIVRQGFPNTSLQIKNFKKVLDKTLKGTFYVEGDILQYDSTK